nr:MAG TPA: hypothetical protein [Caudoviricetes sp.]
MLIHSCYVIPFIFGFSIDDFLFPLPTFHSLPFKV